MIDIKQIGIDISIHRLKIPPMNLRKFDIESEDFYAELQRAVNSGRVDLAETLIAKWKERMPWFFNTNFPDAPPRLIRREGESIKDYLNRIHEKI